METTPNKHLKIIFNIILTVFCGMVLTIIPLPFWLLWFHPSWVLMILVFWLVFFPTYVNLFVFWFVGLLMDVLTGTLIGQSAFTFVITAYIMLRFLDRFACYAIWRQSLFWIVITFINTLIIYGTNALIGDSSFHVIYISAIFLNALLWPIIFSVLRHYYRSFIIRYK
jgi:rod shape-determining protein MreD